MLKLVFAVALSLPSFALAKSEDTTAKGLATIEHNDVAAAREIAIKNALRQAIGQVAGEWVESHFSSETKEVASKKGNEFSQKVEDSVNVDVQGFVESYKIIAEGKTELGYEVSISARINTKKLTSLMEGLAAAIEKAGRKPRVIMAVRERDTTKADALHPPAKVVFAGGFIQHQLIAAGLDVLGGETVWEDGKRAAKSQSADVIVWVDAEYKNLGVIGPDADFAALVGQTRSEIKLTLSSELVRVGKMLSAKPVVMTSIGMDYGRSIQRALQGSGNNAVQVACHDFFTQLKSALEANALSVGRTHLVVRKVVSYKTQAKPLMALIEKLDGVSAVSEAGFANAELKLTVEHGGERGVWQRKLFDQCERIKWCKTLDKLGAEGDSLLLSF